MRTVRTDAGELLVHVTGPDEGRTLLFANSLGSDMRVWDPLLACLRDTYRIVRYDKRGHGLSDCPPAPYTMEALVDDAEAICDALGLSEITFVGLSIGGMIGQGLAARRPDLVRALVLMDTAAKIGTAEFWQERVDMIRASGIDAISPAILERWFTADFRSGEDIAVWRNMLERTPVEGYIGCCQAIAAADLTASTRDLGLPVMALAGAEDGSTPPDLVRATAQLCGASFHVIDGAGHLPCVERPAETAAVLQDFLSATE